MTDVVASCPSCAQTVSWPWPPACPSCGLSLTGPDAERLADIDRHLHTLWQEREQLMARLRPAEPAPAQPSEQAAAAPAEHAEPAAAAPAQHAPPAPATANQGLSAASAQTLLAAAGVTLLVVAAIVFVAVTWAGLGPWPRALIMGTVTVAAARAARALTQRGLTATGEAVSVLTVALALICVHGARSFGLAGLDAVPLALYMAGTYAGLVAGAHALADWSATRAPRALAGALVTVPGPAAVVYLRDTLGLEPAVVESVGLLAAAMATLAYARAVTEPAVARALATAGAVVMWAVSAIVALEFIADSSVAGGLAISVAIAASAGAITRLGGRWESAGAAGAAVVLTGALAVALSVRIDAVLACALVSAAAGGALSLVPAGRARWAATVGVVPVALIASTGVVGLVVILVEQAASVAANPWAIRLTVDGASTPVGWDLVAVVALAGVAAAGVLEGQQRRPAAIGAGITAALVGIAAALEAGQVGAAAQVALGLVTAGVLVGVAAPRASRGLLAASAIPAAWALAWALADPPPTILALAVLAVVAAFPATRRTVAGIDRMLAAAVASAFVVALPATAVAAAGAPAPVAGFVAVLAAGLVVLGVDWSVASGRGDLLAGVEAVAALAAVVGLITAGQDLRWLAAGFAVTGVTAAAHALRADRRWSSTVSGAALSACSWALLADARVEVVEAYTAVPAIAALLIGGWRLRADPAVRSATALGPGLGLALAPTAMVVIGDPGDLVRVLALVSAGAVVALIGTRLRLGAAVIGGVAAVVVTVLTQLGVAASHLPRWVTFAVLGVVLVGFSATYERQVRRVTSARDRLAVLR